MVDGDDVTTPVMPSAIEPLDSFLSWRTAQAGPAVKQSGLGLGEAPRAAPRPVDAVIARVRDATKGGRAATVDGHEVEQIPGFGQYRATVNGRQVKGTLSQVAEEIHSANERKMPAPPSLQNKPDSPLPPKGPPPTLPPASPGGGGEMGGDGITSRQSKSIEETGNRDVREFRPGTRTTSSVTKEKRAEIIRSLPHRPVDMVSAGLDKVAVDYMRDHAGDIGGGYKYTQNDGFDYIFTPEGDIRMIGYNAVADAVNAHLAAHGKANP